MPTRILIADDHPLFCDGLQALLRAQADLEVVGVATNGADAVRMAQRLRPAVALLDVTMPEQGGIEAAECIVDALPGCKVVMLSMHDSAEHVYRALRAGAMGYVLKDCAAREVVAAIRAVQNGKRYLSERIPGLTAVEERLASGGAASPLESLSSREREILQLVIDGHSSARIATLLLLSPKTVETYRSRLMRKLGIADVAGLVKFALRHGLTAP